MLSFFIKSENCFAAKKVTQSAKSVALVMSLERRLDLDNFRLFSMLGLYRKIVLFPSLPQEQSVFVRSVSSWSRLQIIFYPCSSKNCRVDWLTKSKPRRIMSRTLHLSLSRLKNEDNCHQQQILLTVTGMRGTIINIVILGSELHVSTIIFVVIFPLRNMLWFSCSRKQLTDFWCSLDTGKIRETHSFDSKTWTLCSNYWSCNKVVITDKNIK